MTAADLPLRDDAAVRAAWVLFCETTIAAAAARKDSQAVLLVIAARYRELSDEDRVIVDRLLGEELALDEPVADQPWYAGENARFLPLFLIREFRIVSALPALRVLADWLETQNTPGAPHEWAKVNRAIGKLVER